MPPPHCVGSRVMQCRVLAGNVRGRALAKLTVARQSFVVHSKRDICPESAINKIVTAIEVDQML